MGDFSFTSRPASASLYCLRMSLWRVKHTLSPVVEYALVALVAVYGFFGIYMSSLLPFVVATNSPVTSVSEPVSLDQETWTRHDNATYGYAYASPPGWLIDDRDPAAVRLGRSSKEIESAGREGEGIIVIVTPLYEGKAVEDAAASDFYGRHPALYDVTVDGRAALFAIDFERDRVVRQAVYVPLGDRALVIRSARLDPAAFAAFLSDIRFYSPEITTDL
jgi:hypothetical protein